MEYLREYAQSEEKTVFLTSHIIQDMEKLVDDCIIMDYGSILVQMPVAELLATFRRYTFDVQQRAGIACGDLKAETMNLEDAFIGLTGKY